MMATAVEAVEKWKRRPPPATRHGSTHRGAVAPPLALPTSPLALHQPIVLSGRSHSPAA
jgi:hypothetical protein